jgi:hypothetical protein
MSNSTPIPISSQDTDASIVAMLDELLAQDSLYIAPDDADWYELCERTADGDKIIDVYPNRTTAYRAAIDCVIELSIEAWEQGGAE